MEHCGDRKQALAEAVAALSVWCMCVPERNLPSWWGMVAALVCTVSWCRRHLQSLQARKCSKWSTSLRALLADNLAAVVATLVTVSGQLVAVEDTLLSPAKV